MEKSIHNKGRCMSGLPESRPRINQKTLQLIIAMKIFMLLLAISLHVSAAVLSQQITLSVKKAPLREVMQLISKQSGYNFLFKNSLSKDAKPVTISLYNVNIEKALDLIFLEQPFSYTIDNSFIVISKKKEQSDAPSTSSDMSILNLKGRVIDSAGNGLARATVLVKEQKGKIAITNENGEFLLKSVPNNGTIVASMIGFQTKEIKYNGITDLIIRLKTANSVLDEVKVIAYGTTTKRLTTSNISTVKSSEISNQPVNNPLLALQGRLPGIYIEQGSGNSGGSVKVRIQGTNSILNGNNPFYVIDGVPYASALLPSLNTVFGQNGVTEGASSPLSFINPADIESIDILKDADATAIYGSRAANGAILITTKKGVAGRTKFNINMQTGFEKVTRTMPLLNTQQYIQLREDAKKIDKISTLPTDYDINGTWDKNRYTDWQRELIGGTARYHDIQGSLSGGNGSTQFNLGTGFHKETTVYPGDFSDVKGFANFNLNHSSSNGKFGSLFTTMYALDVNKLNNIDLTTYALNTSPNAPSMYNEDGTINWGLTSTGANSFINNPARYIANTYKRKTDNLLSNLQLNYWILPHLNFKTSFGYNKIQSNELQLTPLTSIPTSFSIRTRSALYGDNTIESWIIEPQLNYTKKSTLGSFDVLLGSSFQKSTSTLMALMGSGYNTDKELPNIRAASNITVANSILSTYKYNALFGRINYNLSNKYIINIAARRDGSSRFGSNNLFHNFYSIGGGWVFSEEDFLHHNSDLLSFGKIRASFGTTGNDQIGDYQYLSLYAPVYTDVPYQGVTGNQPVGHSSPNIQWEETKKINLGLDLGLLKNKLELTANYYRNRSSNQLLPYPLPLMTGFVSVLRNIPAKVQNSGLELSLNYQVLKEKKVTWNTNINLTFLKNKLLDFPDIQSSTYANMLVIGQPITITKVYPYAGVDPQTGMYEFMDHTGKKTTSPDPNNDLTQWVNAEPKYFGGWNNSFNFKNVSLDILFQFVKQSGANYTGGNLPGTKNNQPIGILNHWQKPGDISQVQAPSTNGSNFLQYAYYLTSSGSYSDASFIRLKNIALNYDLPNSIVRKCRLSSARIYIHSQNIITFTRFKGMDPENRSLISLPPLRVISFGVNCTL